MLLKKITLLTSSKEKNVIYLLSLIFHLIIILSAGFNPSESIFLILFYNGILTFILGYYLTNNTYVYGIGIFFLSISILFRQHGILALFILYIYFLLYEIYYLKRSIIRNYKKYFWIGLISILPFIISLIHLILIDSFKNVANELEITHDFLCRCLG